MSKSTTSVVALSLVGKSAKELRELLATKSVTAKAVVAFLQEREAERGGLRAPSAKLLAELTGEKVVAPKAEKREAKPEAKRESAKPVAPVSELAALVAAVAALTERIAALEGARAPAAKAPPAKAGKAAAKR